MPRLILHTGLHKTGTTSVQKMLHQNRHVLAEQGFLYPETGQTDRTASWGHHDLAYALRTEAKGRAVWQDLRAEAERAQLPTVIVSSEELSLLPFPTLPALRPYKLISEIFQGYDITVLCYLRPQADMLASLYNHQVKSIGETGDIISFMAKAAPRLDYMQYLHVASAALGEAAIRVRRFGQDWLRGGIVEDLATEIGLTLTKQMRPLKTDLNTGLTAQGLTEMLALNARLRDDPKGLNRARQRLLERHKAQPFESADVLTPDIRQTINALYHYKNAQIGRRFLKLDGNLFDPDVQPLARKTAP
ncbi:MAG: hypothetical protein AAFS01_00085 [Pseudomonadota bacterium]